jgi:GalNAc5-diNAcBac-PP-undecaprenol beta-1,3-glucosyltransferase
MRGRGPVLALAVESILAQTVADLEVFIMGDGVDEPTRAVIQDLMWRDARVRFFDHPKHERRGETHRHAALAEARGRIVCYLCDRDLMLPEHVETMARLLQNADFAHSLLTLMQTDGTLLYRTWIDLAHLPDRQWAAREFRPENGIPLSFAAHTLAMYRKLPCGWHTTPKPHFTDIYMWQQFLAQPDCRAASGTMPTILSFPRWLRKEWTIEQKRLEIERWLDKSRAPGWNEHFRQLVIDCITPHCSTKARQLHRIVSGGDPLVNYVKLLGRAIIAAAPPGFRRALNRIRR